MPSSVIVYRNPLEQWFWEGDGALYFLVLIVAVLAFAFLYSTIESLYWRIIRWRRTGKWKKAGY